MREATFILVMFVIGAFIIGAGLGRVIDHLGVYLP